MPEQDSDVLAILNEPPIEDFLHEVATSVKSPPLGIVACLLRFDEAGPLLLTVLERAAAGEKLTEDEKTLCFRGLYILAGHREPKAFEPLLRLLRRPEEEIDQLLGEAATESLSRIVAGVFDGDVDALFGAVADNSIDEFVRHSLLHAAAFLTFDGKIPRERTEQFLRRFHEERLAADDDHVWAGWTEAIALLGLRSLAPLAEQAFREDRLPVGYTTLQYFAADLATAESAPGDIERFSEFNLGYIEDVYEDLLRFEPSRNEEDNNQDTKLGSRDWGAPIEPYVNHLRHVGRNDPCPCGSGKKAKRCCLAA
jgi:hypothetical protein